MAGLVCDHLRRKPVILFPFKNPEYFHPIHSIRIEWLVNSMFLVGLAFAGFHKWGYPILWMVYSGESY